MHQVTEVQEDSILTPGSLYLEKKLLFRIRGILLMVCLFVLLHVRLESISFGITDFDKQMAVEKKT